MSFLSGSAPQLGQAPQLGAPPQINFNPAGFNASGGSASFAGGQYGFAPSAGATANIGGLQSTFGQQAGALGQLRQQVAPGFSQFRAAGLDQLNTQQQATTSNLRDNLAQRRILGSSFAQDSLSRSDAEFAQQKAQFTAQSYLQEVATSQQLIQQQFQAATQSYAVGVNQMNFETGIAAQLTSQATSASASVAEAQARIDQTQSITQAQLQQQRDIEQAKMTQQSDAANAAGMGKLIGTGLSLGLAPFTGGASLAGLPAIWGGGGGGGGFFGSGGGGGGGGLTLPGGYSSFADAGLTGGTGSGGYNFMDAQA